MRVEGTELVHTVDGAERRSAIVSLAAASEPVRELLGEPARAALANEPLAIDTRVAALIASVFDFGERALSAFAAEAGPGDRPTAPTLWPEHFDIAIDSGSEADGRRATYGVSPGDGEHELPSAYVGPWRAGLEGALWNARGFAGAELGYQELAAAADPLAAILSFWRERRQALETTEAHS